MTAVGDGVVVAVRSFRQKGPPHRVGQVQEYLKFGKAVQVPPLKHGSLAHGSWPFCDVVEVKGAAVADVVDLEISCVVIDVLGLVLPVLNGAIVVL